MYCDIDWVNKFLPYVLPLDWKLIQTVKDGAAFESNDKLQVICSGLVEEDGKRWIHISLSRTMQRKLPTYYDLMEVKNLFIGEDKKAIQIISEIKNKININPFCLHLFHCLDGYILPDFTKGSRSL